MDDRITEYINSLIPEYISENQKLLIREEFSSHILDRIDYYSNRGYKDEECLQKAMNDFGEDSVIKDSIKKQMQKIHRTRSLADFFVKAIPAVIGVFVIFSLVTDFLLTLWTIKVFIVFPIALWVVILILKNSIKIPKLIKSIVSLVLVVPFFLFSVVFQVFISSTYLSKTLNDDKALIAYQNVIDSYEYVTIPQLNDIGNPIDADFYHLYEESIFTEPNYYTLICEYSIDEYSKTKEKLNSAFQFQQTFLESDIYSDEEYYILHNCTFNVFGFDFKTIEQEKREIVYEDVFDDEEVKQNFELYYEDMLSDPTGWVIIGTNDETKQIAYIIVEPYSFTPTFDDEFIEDYCGWRYFYYIDYLIDLK